MGKYIINGITMFRYFVFFLFVIIIAFLFFYRGPAIGDNSFYTENNLERCSNVILHFWVRNNRKPKNIDELNSAYPDVFKDSWGNGLILDTNKDLLISSGVDLKFGTSDDLKIYWGNVLEKEKNRKKCRMNSKKNKSKKGSNASQRFLCLRKHIMNKCSIQITQPDFSTPGKPVKFQPRTIDIIQLKGHFKCLELISRYCESGKRII